MQESSHLENSKQGLLGLFPDGNITRHLCIGQVKIGNGFQTSHWVDKCSKFDKGSQATGCLGQDKLQTGTVNGQGPMPILLQIVDQSMHMLKIDAMDRVQVWTLVQHVGCHMQGIQLTDPCAISCQPRVEPLSICQAPVCTLESMSCLDHVTNMFADTLQDCLDPGCRNPPEDVSSQDDW